MLTDTLLPVIDDELIAGDIYMLSALFRDDDEIVLLDGALARMQLRQSPNSSTVIAEWTSEGNDGIWINEEKGEISISVENTTIFRNYANQTLVGDLELTLAGVTTTEFRLQLTVTMDVTR